MWKGNRVSNENVFVSLSFLTARVDYEVSDKTCDIHIFALGIRSNAIREIATVEADTAYLCSLRVSGHGCGDAEESGISVCSADGLIETKLQGGSWSIAESSALALVVSTRRWVGLSTSTCPSTHDLNNNTIHTIATVSNITHLGYRRSVSKNCKVRLSEDTQESIAKY